MTLAVVTRAANFGIDIAILPPHTTHKLQPLDVVVLKLFKSNFGIVREKFTREKLYVFLTILRRISCLCTLGL